MLPLNGDKKPQPFLQTDFSEREGRFSPNGRWIAYSSNQSGQYEVYVRPSSPSAAQWQASKNGGIQPRWRRDGKELFYLTSDGKMMAVSIQEVSNAIEAGIPTQLFDTQVGIPLSATGSSRSDYAVTPDGQRFLVITPTQNANADQAHVVLNWPAILKK